MTANMNNNGATSIKSMAMPQVEPIIEVPSPDQISSMSMQQQMELSQQLSQKLIYLT